MAEIRQGDSVSGRPYTNDKNDNFTLLPREYWISPDALVILLNALDNPQYAQVSLLSGAVVMAYRYGVIDYSYNMNYRTWTLQAFNTLFDRTDRVHVYAQLDKDGKDALIIYSYDKLELQGIATDNTGQQKNVFNVYLGTISAAVDDQGADIPRTWEYPLVTGNLRTDLGINQGQTLWVDNFEIRTDDFGVEYLFAKKPLATIGGLVQYATPDIVVPSLFEGIPFDNKTIWLNPDTKVVEVIGGGGTGDLNLEKMWAALAGSTSEPINKSHLTAALTGYATEEWINKQGFVKSEDLEKTFVTIATEQEITGLKHFIAGLSVGSGKHKLYEKDGVVYFDGDLAVTGGITQYALGDTEVSTIMDGVVVDGTTIKKEDGKLVVIGGGGSGDLDLEKMWQVLEGNTNEQINASHLTTALQSYATQSWASSMFLGKNDTATNADKLDGYHANGLLTSITSSRSTNLSVTVGGTTKTISSLHADYAYALGSPVTIWGQTFRGNNNISGVLSQVGGINFSKSGSFKIDEYGNIRATVDSDSYYWNIVTYNEQSALVVKSQSGWVGIGTINPTDRLHVNGSARISDRLIIAGAGIDTSYGNNWKFIRNGWDGGKGDYVTFFVPGNNSQDAYFEMRSNGTFFVNYNILATGGITQYSDQRAKTILEQIVLPLQSIADAPTIRFRWNGWKQKDDGKTHIGGIAQYIQTILPEVIYNSEGVLTMDYATTGYIFAVQTAKHLLNFETKTDKEIKKLKKEVVFLKNKLKKLGYEETDTLAN